MKRIIYCFSLFTSLLIYSEDVFPQRTPDVPTRNYEVLPKSPTATQFLRYDELPISEYTGIPNISIPIYNIQEDDFNLPITLSYHAGGIKVNQDASWVGLGWDLSLASVIQIINDRDDFFEEYPKFSKTRFLPDYFNGTMASNYGYQYFPIKSSQGIPNIQIPHDNPQNQDPQIVEPKLAHNYWLCTDYYFSINKQRAGHYNLLEPTKMADSEPDIFKINLFGETLNVIIDFRYSSNYFIVLNKQGYKVNKSSNTWVVTNPKGQQFYFTDNSFTRVDNGKYEIRENGNISGGAGSANMYNSRIWMLNKIITETGKEINIRYRKSSKEIVTITKNHNQDFLQYPVSVSRLTGSGTGYYYGLHSSTPRNQLIEMRNTTYEYQFYIESITFPKGNISFTLTDRTDINYTKKLSKIEVFNLLNQNVKSIDFNYDYFIERNNAGQRLKLVSIKENNDATHNFIYNTKQLPAKNSYEQDYWGYCNGKLSNKSIVPNPKRFKFQMDNGNNLSASVEFTKTAVLESIKYPTGGSVYFNYELNQFNNYWIPDVDSLDNKISKGLGLRIKSIIYKDSNGSIEKSTNYKYEGGKANIKIAMVMPNFSRTSFEGDYERSASILSSTVNGFNTSNPLSSMNGVGYGKVTRQDYSNAQDKGKIITFYNNNPHIVPPHTGGGVNMPTYIPLPAFKDIQKPENGTPVRICYYDKNNSLQKEEIFEYLNQQSAIYYGAKVAQYAPYYLRFTNTLSGSGASVNYYPVQLIGFYPIVDFESLLINKKIKEYSENDSILYEETYGYNPYRLLVNKRIINNSRDESINYVYKYPNDFSVAAPYNDMVMKNILNPVIEKEVLLNSSLLQKERTDYSYWHSKFYAPINIKKQMSSDGYLEPRIKYDFFINGNIKEIVKDDSDKSVYLWSYNYQYPIAEIKNATYSQVSGILTQALIDRITGAVEPSASDMAAINNLRSNTSLNALVTTYTYKPLVGMLTSTDPSGITTYYEYDTFNRLKRTYIKEGTTEKNIQTYDYHYQNQ